MRPFRTRRKKLLTIPSLDFQRSIHKRISYSAKILDFSVSLRFAWIRILADTKQGDDALSKSQKHTLYSF